MSLQQWRLSLGEGEDGTVKPAIGVAVFHREHIYFLLEQTKNASTPIGYGHFCQRACGAPNRLLEILFSENILDGSNTHLRPGLGLAGLELQHVSLDRQLASGVGFDVS